MSVNHHACIPYSTLVTKPLLPLVIITLQLKYDTREVWG